MQTVLAMVEKLPVLQKPNALFTLCIHQKSMTKYSLQVLFFFEGGGKELSNYNKGVLSPLVSVSLYTSFNTPTHSKHSLFQQPTGYFFCISQCQNKHRLLFQWKKEILILRDWGQNRGERATFFSSVTFHRQLKKQHFTKIAVNVL